jgi:glycosyltransferase involved in cell wall biosynthesis
LNRYECHVAASGYLNRELFPHPAVHLIDSEKWLTHRLLQVRHLLTRFEWPDVRRIEAAGIARVVRETAPQLVHVHFLWNLGVVADLAAQQGIPLVVTAHGTDVHRALADEGYRHRVQENLQHVALIIAVSEYIAERLREIGCSDAKIRMLHLGAPIPAAKAQVAPKDGQVRVLCVAAFRKMKGHKYLLEAFAQALERESRLFLTLVGDGELRHEIERQVLELGIREKVKLTGHAPPEEVREIMVRSHIYAQHSVHVEDIRPGGGLRVQEEGLSISMAEAASFGLPMVATRSGGLGEICLDGETGYLVDERDVSAMADRIVELAQSAETAQRMGANARLLAEREFDSEAQLSKIEDLYDEMLA